VTPDREPPAPLRLPPSLGPVELTEADVAAILNAAKEGAGSELVRRLKETPYEPPKREDATR
jgi:hypothetical protein